MIRANVDPMKFHITILTTIITVLALSAVSKAGDGDILRVVVTPGAAVHEKISSMSSNQTWQLRYKFVVPPLPRATSWDYKSQEIYIWGDVDFDDYGTLGGANKINHYRFNQIVPQLMMGDTVALSGPNYGAQSKVYDHWVIQAQYYWVDDSDNKSYALAGDVIAVEAGEVLTTVIEYNSDDGSIKASIASEKSESVIKIPRPFPNEKLYQSWKDFFEQAEAKTGSVLAQAVMNVEAHTGADTIESLLPFQFKEMSGPGFKTPPDEYRVRTEGGFSCQKTLVELVP
jgi:hypothetical protein